MTQADWELSFWRSELSKGVEAFLEQRQADWQEHLRHFPELVEKGELLEVGTGLVSVFEFSPKQCVSIDPLQAAYEAIYRKQPSIVDYRTDWEGIAEDSFAEVLCVNVLDHTPDPSELVNQIRRALKPGGKLYFELNFDFNLSPAHYGLWDKAKLDSFLSDFRLVRESYEPNPAYNQTRYWATYICEKPLSSSPATSSTKKSPSIKKNASTRSKRTPKKKTSS